MQSTLAHLPGMGASASVPPALWRPDADTGTSEEHPHLGPAALRSESQSPIWMLFQK